MKRAAPLLLFLLGAWSCGTLFMWQTAIQNFAVAEAVASSPHEGLATAADGLAPGGLRFLVRHQASEVNRLFFSGWGWVQLGLATLAFLLAWVCRCGRVVVVLIGAMLLITVALAAYVVPETVRLGRLMDFAAGADGPPPAIRRHVLDAASRLYQRGHAEIRDGFGRCGHRLPPRYRGPRPCLIRASANPAPLDRYGRADLDAFP